MMEVEEVVVDHQQMASVAEVVEAAHYQSMAEVELNG